MNTQDTVQTDTNDIQKEEAQNTPDTNTVTTTSESTTQTNTQSNTQSDELQTTTQNPTTDNINTQITETNKKQQESDPQSITPTQSVTKKVTEKDNNIEITTPNTQITNTTSTIKSTTKTATITTAEMAISQSLRGAAANSTFTVKVHEKDSTTAVTTGTVSIYSNGNKIGESTVDNTGTVTVNYPFSTAGTYNIVFNYNDTTGAYRNTTTNETISINASTVMMKITRSNGTTVSPAAITVNLLYPNGSVNSTVTKGLMTLYLNGVEVETANVGSSGTVTFSHQFSTTGTYQFVLKYTDSSNTFNSSSKPVDVGVTKSNSKMYITITKGTTTTDSSFKILVKDENNNTVTTGTVSVYNGNTLLDTETLVNGAATVKCIISPAGSYVLTYYYNDTTGKYQDKSANSTVEIPTTPTNMTVSIIKGTPTINTTFNINISELNGNKNPVTTGTVYVYNDNTLLGSQDITNGTVTIKTLLSSVKTYNITIKYLDPSNIYSDNTATTNVTPLYDVSKMNITVNSGTTTSNTTFTIIMKDSADNLLKQGTVYVYADDILIGTENVTTGEVVLSSLVTPTGQHRINITYTDPNNIYENNTQNLTITTKPTSTYMYVHITTAQDTPLITATVRITLPDKTTSIQQGTITLYDGDTAIGTGTVGSTGIVLVSGYLNSAGTRNVTVVYSDPAGIYDNNTSNKQEITITRAITTIVLNPVIGTVGETITLQANVTDKEGNGANNGKVVFKVNGKTLKDENGTTLYANVIGGVAKLNYTIPAFWTKSNVTISAVYSGTGSLYNSSVSKNSTVKVSNRNATVTVTTSKPSAIAYDKITFTTTVRDTNGSLVNAGQVCFKINGKTIKDSNGKTIIVNVTNGIAQLNYTIPDGTSAHNYTITSVFSGPGYSRTVGVTTQEVTKIAANTTITQAKQSGSSLILTGIIHDTNNHKLVGITKVVFKINGKTVLNTTNGSIFYITNGSFSNLKIETQFKNTTKFKTLTIVTGEKNGYKSSRNSTEITA